MRREVLLADRLEPLPPGRPWPEVFPRELQRLVQLGAAFGRERHADELPPLFLRDIGGADRADSDLQRPDRLGLRARHPLPGHTREVTGSAIGR